MKKKNQSVFQYIYLFVPCLYKVLITVAFFLMKIWNQTVAYTEKNKHICKKVSIAKNLQVICENTEFTLFV